MGVDHTTGVRRRQAVQRLRFAAGLRRLRRVARMARAARPAARLAVTGAMAQTTSGFEVTGMSPAQRLRVRRALGAAAGHRASGRCLGTVVAMVNGPGADPLIYAPVAVIEPFLRCWRGADEQVQAEIQAAWNSVVRRHAPTSRWQRIGGPVSATVATWKQLGWVLVSPTHLIDPQGDHWVVDPAEPMHPVPVLDLLRRQLRQRVHQRIAAGHCGAGADLGIDWRTTERLLQQLRGRDGRKVDAALLETILAGGIWPLARRAEAGLLGAAVCPRCGRALEDEWHRYWQCAENARFPDQAVRNSQHLADEAVSQRGVADALWCRGLMPIRCQRFPEAAAAAPGVRVWGTWQRGRGDDIMVATDASGGPYSPEPRLRRCG